MAPTLALRSMAPWRMTGGCGWSAWGCRPASYKPCCLAVQQMTGAQDQERVPASLADGPHTKQHVEQDRAGQQLPLQL
jgi:hypothetical protein